MCYSLWYNAPTMLPAGGRQHRPATCRYSGKVAATVRQVPDAVNTVVCAPYDG